MAEQPMEEVNQVVVSKVEILKISKHQYNNWEVSWKKLKNTWKKGETETNEKAPKRRKCKTIWWKNEDDEYRQLHCTTSPKETAQHFIAECQKLTGTTYATRHNYSLKVTAVQSAVELRRKFYLEEQSGGQDNEREERWSKRTVKSFAGIGNTKWRLLTCNARRLDLSLEDQDE